MLTQNSLAEKLKSKMIAVQGQDCWLVAKLTSVADCDLKVNMIDLHVNPNFAAQIQPSNMHQLDVNNTSLHRHGHAPTNYSSKTVGSR